MEAVHEAKNEDGSTDSRKFLKEFKMPGGVVGEQLSSTYSGAGILTVSAPRVIQAPEGAQVTQLTLQEDLYGPLGDFVKRQTHSSLKGTIPP